jgi:hypothetical protein
MRRMQRILLLAVIVGVMPVLAGCADFDPDKLDIFGLSEKKKLPGDRKAVFPEGVPGVSQGIPPEFMKGNQPPPETAQTIPAEPDNKAAGAGPSKKTAAVEPAEKPKPKAKPKATAKRKAKTNATAATPAASDQQPAPAPWPTQGQATTNSPWPSAPASGSR